MFFSFIKNSFSILFQYFQKNKLYSIVYGLGFIEISYITFRFSRFLYKSFIRPAKTLPERYGSNSWVLMAGNIDELAKSFCLELASQGFNICIISKNNYKIVRFSKIINSRFPHIKTKEIQADFDDSLNKDFFKKIDPHIEEIDISILINNVGLSKKCKSLQESSDEDLKEVLISNCFPIVLVTKRILNKMLYRTKKSAIINLSSQFWHFPGRSPLYCASRAFEGVFSESLTKEFHDKIDVLSYSPFYFSNSENRFNKGNFWNIEPTRAVHACLKEIGYEAKTYGHWKHNLMAMWMHVWNSKGKLFYARKTSHHQNYIEDF